MVKDRFFRGKRKEDTIRVNRQIRFPEVRVVGPEGEVLGVMSPQEGIALAEEYGLDLVEVAPNSRPPVCRILNYGKFKYEQKKKKAEKKKRSATVAIKEVKFRVKIETHDFDFKVKHIKKFLGQGHKCKVTVMFRGREITHPELAAAILKKVIAQVGTMAIVENNPRIEGRNMSMLLTPDLKEIARLAKEEDEVSKKDIDNIDKPEQNEPDKPLSDVSATDDKDGEVPSEMKAIDDKDKEVPSDVSATDDETESPVD